MRADNPLFDQLASVPILRLIPISLASRLILSAALQNSTAPKVAHAPVDESAVTSSSRAHLARIPDDGERIAFIGNGLAERDLVMGCLGTELPPRFPTMRLIIRNMGHSGDTPGSRPQPASGSQWAFRSDAEFNPEFSSRFRKGFFPTPDRLAGFSTIWS